MNCFEKEGRETSVSTAGSWTVDKSDVHGPGGGELLMMAYKGRFPLPSMNFKTIRTFVGQERVTNQPILKNIDILNSASRILQC